MIGALETIRKYETTNAHLVNDKYAKRIWTKVLTASRSILYISETEPDVISKSFSLHARIQNWFFLGGGGLSLPLGGGGGGPEAYFCKFKEIWIYKG